MTANRYKGMLVMRTVMAALHSSGTTFTEKNPEVGDYKANPNSILDDNIKLVAYDDPIYEADSFVETELCRKGAKTRAAGWCNGDKDTIIIRFTTNERMPNGKEESFPVNVKVNWNSLPKFVKEVAKFCG